MESDEEILAMNKQIIPALMVHQTSNKEENRVKVKENSQKNV